MILISKQLRLEIKTNSKDLMSDQLLLKNTSNNTEVLKFHQDLLKLIQMLQQESGLMAQASQMILNNKLLKQEIKINLKGLLFHRLQLKDRDKLHQLTHKQIQIPQLGNGSMAQGSLMILSNKLLRLDIRNNLKSLLCLQCIQDTIKIMDH